MNVVYVCVYRAEDEKERIMKEQNEYLAHYRSFLELCKEEMLKIEVSAQMLAVYQCTCTLMFCKLMFGMHRSMKRDWQNCWFLAVRQ